MKITSSRYDELKKAREEYDAETARLKDQESALVDEYHSAIWDAKIALEKKISDLIGTTSLKIRINVDPYGRYGSNSWSIEINANDANKFDDDVALAWNWKVSLDKDGNIVKDSGSWSGLKAVTPEQVADLEESVRVIKLLNNADWNPILNSAKPEYYDYVDSKLGDALRDRKANRPDFEKDMVDSRLEDLIGEDIAIKLTDDQYYRGNVGIILTGMTDKFLKGYIFPWSLAEKGRTAQEIKDYVYNEPRKTAKTKIIEKNGLPVEIKLA